MSTVGTVDRIGKMTENRMGSARGVIYRVGVKEWIRCEVGLRFDLI